MEATISSFLNILKAALSGEKAAIDRQITPEEWDRLIQIARIHNVLPLIYDTVYDTPCSEAAQPLLASVKRPVMRQVVMQTMQTTEFLKLNRRLQAADVCPLVVKGIICRNLYPKPDYRPSGDEDVLILPNQFEICHRVLMDFGMQTTASPETIEDAYEVPYTKNGSPLYIELHKHLFPPNSDAYGDMNRFFEGVRDRAVAENIQGNTVYTMAPTDHLFYLICHSFKHFLHSGFGIRQVCDIVLYANRYGTQIDWMQVLENCKAIRADQFAAALFQIGSRHLVFDPDRAAYPQVWRDIQVDEIPMLEDLLSSGVYGDASMSRKHSSNITLDAVAAQKQGKQAKNSILSSLFPSAAKLEGRYPYLKKRPYLLPTAWCIRLLRYAAEKDPSQDNSAAEALKIGSERIALMKTYGIIN